MDPAFTEGMINSEFAQKALRQSFLVTERHGLYHGFSLIR
jgi:hypothetical protein